MDTSTDTPQTSRHGAVLAAGAAALGALGICGLVVAAAAAAAPVEEGTAASGGAVGIAAIWADTDAATRHSVCTSHLSDPAGTWQVLAPVLTAHGADRASTAALLDMQCVDEVSLGDLRR